MMYPYMTWNDDTEFVHSGVLHDQYDKRYIKVYVEAPTSDGFKNAWYYLPQNEWGEVSGFVETELDEFASFIKRNAPLITEFAETGGVLSANNI